MMNKDDFKLNDNVEITVYSYDDYGTEYVKNVTGKVIQLTNDLIVLDRRSYKESFKYCELSPNKPNSIIGEPYDLSIETYEEDIVQNCIKDLKKKGSGFVFTKEQVEKVMGHYLSSSENSRFVCRESDGVTFIEKI